MNPFLLPAVLALGIKIVVLVYSHKANKPLIFTGLLLMLAALNLCEVLAYTQLSSGSTAETLIRAYYSIMFFCLAYLSLYSLEVARKKVSMLGVLAVFSLPVVLSALALFTDFIIVGTQRVDYSLEAIQGNQYWLATIGIFVGISFTAFVLSYSVWRAESTVQKIKSGFILCSLFPLLAASMAILVLRWFGINANSAIIIPLATTAFLVIVVWGESRYKIYDIRRWLPFSEERRWANKMVELSYKCSLDEISYRDAVSEFELQLLRLKLEKNNNNISAAAKVMGVKRSSVYSMKSRLETRDK